MNYQIVLKDIEPIHVAYMKYVGVVTEANKVFPHVFKAIMGKTNGAPLFNYLSLNKETNWRDGTLCSNKRNTYWKWYRN